MEQFISRAKLKVYFGTPRREPKKSRKRGTRVMQYKVLLRNVVITNKHPLFEERGIETVRLPPSGTLRAIHVRLIFLLFHPLESFGSTELVFETGE